MCRTKIKPIAKYTGASLIPHTAMSMSVSTHVYKELSSACCLLFFLSLSCNTLYSYPLNQHIPVSPISPVSPVFGDACPASLVPVRHSPRRRLLIPSAPSLCSRIPVNTLDFLLPPARRYIVERAVEQPPETTCRATRRTSHWAKCVSRRGSQYRTEPLRLFRCESLNGGRYWEDGHVGFLSLYIVTYRKNLTCRYYRDSDNARTSQPHTWEKGDLVDSFKKALHLRGLPQYKAYNAINTPSRRYRSPRRPLIRHPIHGHNHPLLQRLRLLFCNHQRIIKSLDDLLVQPIPDILSL